MPAEIRVQVVGGKALAQKLGRLSDLMQGSALIAAVQAGANLIRNEASRRAPYRTGNLRRSLHTEVVTATYSRVTARVGTDVDYAAQVEFGGTIRPRTKKVLAWVTSGPRPKTKAGWRAARKEGRAVYARSVTTKPHPYLVPAFMAKGQAAANEVAASLRIILRKLGSGRWVPYPPFSALRSC